MKSILVTGGSGFLGKHLITELIKKKYLISHATRNKDNSSDDKFKSKEIIVDLSNYDPIINSLVKDKDIIIHLAADLDINKINEKPKEHILNNINSTLNILEDIRLNNPSCLLIFASSEKVYGNVEGDIKEETQCFPNDSYGCSKFICEKLIDSYHKTYNINYINFRFSNIFGPNQRIYLFIPSVITKIISNPENVQIGNLKPYRNFTFINDALQAIVNVIENEKAVNNTFNISSYNTQISHILSIILDLFKEKGIDPKIYQDEKLFRPEEKEIKQYILNCEKARKILSWKPAFNLQEAIEITFKNYWDNDLNTKNKP